MFSPLSQQCLNSTLNCRPVSLLGLDRNSLNKYFATFLDSIWITNPIRVIMAHNSVSFVKAILDKHFFPARFLQGPSSSQTNRPCRTRREAELCVYPPESPGLLITLMSLRLFNYRQFHCHSIQERSLRSVVCVSDLQSIYSLQKKIAL